MNLAEKNVNVKATNILACGATRLLHTPQVLFEGLERPFGLGDVGLVI